MGRQIKLLILEDKPADADLMLYELGKAGFEPDWKRVDTREDYIAGVEGGPDLILADYSLPQFNAMEALKLLQGRDDDIPVIVVTISISEEVAVACMREGAADYLLKDRLTRLGPAVERALDDKRLRQQRRQAIEALRQSEERYRRIVETANEGIWVVDTANRTVFVNKRMADLLGTTMAEMSGKSMFEFVDEEWRSVAEAKAEDAHRSTRHRHVFKFRRKSGAELWAIVSTSPITDGEGNQIGSLSMIIDITERKRADAEHDRLATAIEQAAETILITDPAGVIQYVNPAFEQTTGYSKDEAIGQTPAFLSSGNHSSTFYEDMWKKINAGEVWRGHFTNRRKDGSLYEEDAVISAVRDSAGKIINFVAVKRDITSEVSLQHQLLQSQKMEAVGQLAGGVAHDFNNLLMVIVNGALFAKDSLDADSKAHVEIDEVIRAGRRARELTRQLLAFSRGQPMVPEVLHMGAVVEGVEKMLRRLIGENIELVVEAGEEEPAVKADPGQIEQVLMNLAVNARDAMPKGGKLLITTGVVDLAEDDASDLVEGPTALRGEYATLVVRDTGEGMDADVLPRIFEPFFTTKDVGDGTGLGLSTMYGIVRQHDGFVGVSSEVGVGTTFRILLPILGKSGEGLKHEEEAREVPTGDETVLLVEDDFYVLNVAARMLRALGYTVLAAESAADALVAAREHSGEIQLLMADVVMPGQDGHALAVDLLAVSPNMKVLFASGFSKGELIRRGVLGRGTAFIRKPFESKELGRAVRAVLDGAAAAPVESEDAG